VGSNPTSTARGWFCLPTERVGRYSLAHIAPGATPGPHVPSCPDPARSPWFVGWLGHPGSLPGRVTSVGCRAGSPWFVAWLGGPGSSPGRVTSVGCRARSPWFVARLGGPGSLPGRVTSVGCRAGSPWFVAWLGGPGSLPGRVTSVGCRARSPVFRLIRDAARSPRFLAWLGHLCSVRFVTQLGRPAVATFALAGHLLEPWIPSPFRLVPHPARSSCRHAVHGVAGLVARNT
jgi:hypothetical protein